MTNEEAGPSAGPVAVADPNFTTGRCPECQRRFVNSWERIQHHNGRHHYRAWTPQDGARQAESLHDGRSLAAALHSVAPATQAPLFGNSVEGRYLELVEAEP